MRVLDSFPPRARAADSSPAPSTLSQRMPCSMRARTARGPGFTARQTTFTTPSQRPRFLCARNEKARAHRETGSWHDGSEPLEASLGAPSPGVRGGGPRPRNAGASQVAPRHATSYLRARLQLACASRSPGRVAAIELLLTGRPGSSAAGRGAVRVAHSRLPTPVRPSRTALHSIVTEMS